MAEPGLDRKYRYFSYYRFASDNPIDKGALWVGCYPFVNRMSRC